MTDAVPPPTPKSEFAAPRRIDSLDQFRGYTVVGMLLVNFIGGFVVMPPILKHHKTYCSYADTIMPQFFFAVGFAYRMTMLRRREREGARSAYWHAITRNIGLILIGFAVYHLDGNYKKWADLQALGIWGVLSTAFQKEVFQTLVHIALASLWVLPVIGGKTRTLGIWIVVSALAHLGLSQVWYYDWLMKRGVIDGGPFGFLSWAIPVLVGAIAFDAMKSARKEMVLALGGLAVALMAVGYGITCIDGAPDAPPFYQPNAPVNIWTMSQKSGSISYQIFAAGFSLAVYLFFVGMSDGLGFKLGLFRTFGKNALAVYILHGIVAGAVKPFVPDDAPLWYVALGFWLYFGLTYLFVRYLEKNNLFLKL